MVRPGRIGRQTKEAREGRPCLLTPVAQKQSSSGGAVGMQFLRNREKMTHWVFPAWQCNRAFVAGRVFAERDLLGLSIGKGQTEGGLFMDGRRDRADIRIVTKDTEEMRLSIFPYIAVDPQANAGRGLFRNAQILKQPESKVCILHRPRPPSSPASQ